MENKYVRTQKVTEKKTNNNEIGILQNVRKERDKVANAVSLSSLFLLLFLQAHCAALDQLRKRQAGVSLQYSKSEMRMHG